MKKIILLAALLIAFSALAYAECTDTDGGPVDPAKPTKFIGSKGAVDYGMGPKDDYCISRENGIKMQDSNWVRENYCYDGKAYTKDYLCSAYDYKSCVDGACIDYTGTQAALDDVGVPPPKESYENCGNDKLDGKEECDPPGKICLAYGGGAGTCTSECKCVKASSQANTTAQSNDTNTTGTVEFHINATDENKTAKNATKKAKDIVQAEEPEQPEESDSEAQGNNTMSSPTGALPTDIQEIIKETNDEIEDYSKKPGIRITSAIASSARAFWNWIISLFGG